MLVLTRKKDERILIGDNIILRVLETHGSRVRIGIEAPTDVPIRRAEISPFANDPHQRPAIAESAPAVG
ncbi:MAG: carbon storage regulator [Planctomycetaceae bacterium]